MWKLICKLFCSIFGHKYGKSHYHNSGFCYEYWAECFVCGDKVFEIEDAS